MNVTITSYGLDHDDPPPVSANRILVPVTDLRHPSGPLWALWKRTRATGLDTDVAGYVMTSRGAKRLADLVVAKVRSRDDLPQLDVHVASDAGRRRSVAFAEALAERLRALQQDDITVTVVHRHIHRPLPGERGFCASVARHLEGALAAPGYQVADCRRCGQAAAVFPPMWTPPCRCPRPAPRRFTCRADEADLAHYPLYAVTQLAADTDEGGADR
ncbi:RapZ C-terminal domain-containing protein [Streptomyces synnematoformans]|uniref:RapZ C-terminal domain-containing protein n=1 Tax=Streptomyces synnematoformans TaxID=415721 RepID=A0ABN2XHH0_9ACTN